MKDLLEAGVHFGHKSANWDPRMKKYIFMKRKGVHIIDLQKTLSLVEEAYQYVKNVAANGGSILFVGTKKQAKQSIIDNAQRCGEHYVGNRWIGGLLTNFKTVRKSIDKMLELEKTIQEQEKLKSDISNSTAPGQESTVKKHSKKQIGIFTKQLAKLEATFGGLKKMKNLPDIIFTVDSSHEEIAISEAKMIHIPVVALVDTNSNPENVDVIIPGNDDAIRAINLFIAYIADAVIEGKAIRAGHAGSEQSEFIQSVTASDEETIKPEQTAGEASAETDSSKESELPPEQSNEYTGEAIEEKYEEKVIEMQSHFEK